MSEEGQESQESDSVFFVLADVLVDICFRLIFFGLPLVLIGYGIFWLWWRPPQVTGPLFPPEDPLGAAYSVCEHFVTASLDTPSTAQFSGRFSDDTTIDSGKQVPPNPSSEAPYGPSQVAGWQYRIRSYVDAQNNSGAVIRNRFVCTATWGHAVGSGDSDHWFLDDLAKTPWQSSPMDSASTTTVPQVALTLDQASAIPGFAMADNLMGTITRSSLPSEVGKHVTFVSLRSTQPKIIFENTGATVPVEKVFEDDRLLTLLLVASWTGGVEAFVIEKKTGLFAYSSITGIAGIQAEASVGSCK